MTPDESAPPPLVDALLAPLTSALRTVLVGADEDLRTYAQAIALDVAALTDSASPSAGLDELEAQALLLVEVNRLRVETAGRLVLRGLVRGVATTALAFASAGLADLLSKLPPPTSSEDTP